MTNNMILNRIKPYLNPILRPIQNGIKPERSTNSHILALRYSIEGVKCHNIKAIIIFVDFEEVILEYQHRIMLRILKAYVIPLTTLYKRSP